MTRRSNPQWSVRLAQRFADTLPSMLDDAGKAVEQESKRIIYLGRPEHLNRQTGMLESSITRELTEDALSVTASVGTSCSYAPAHEFGQTIALPSGGFAVIPARPFLDPAFRAAAPQALADMHSKFRRMLEEICP